jgi:4-diphosphocytidyl-2-C-methyl-D-erythritol kinase
MEKLTLPAPAKLNLWLHIRPPRRRLPRAGNVFQFLDHGDELSFACATTA